MICCGKKMEVVQTIPIELVEEGWLRARKLRCAVCGHLRFTREREITRTKFAVLRAEALKAAADRREKTLLG